MGEFETVHDEEGFSYKRKRIPDDGRTLGRARVTRLDALGLQNSCLRRPFSSHDASEHLTQLRAAKGKYLEGPCSLGRARRVSGRLSALRIRMTITYSPHPP